MSDRTLGGGLQGHPSPKADHTLPADPACAVFRLSTAAELPTKPTMFRKFSLVESSFCFSNTVIHPLQIP